MNDVGCGRGSVFEQRVEVDRESGCAGLMEIGWIYEVSGQRGSVCGKRVQVDRESGRGAGLMKIGWTYEISSQCGSVCGQRVQVDRWRRRLNTGLGLEIVEPVARLVHESVGPYSAHCAHDVPRFENGPQNLVCWIMPKSWLGR